MLFSVIIPTYNRGHLLAETLASVFNQEFQDFEIIVVDDGSTDDTARILERYGTRVRCFAQSNCGPAVARNIGIRHACAEYVAFLDSDDLWFPWTLENYRQAIARFRRPSFVAGVHQDFTESEKLKQIPRREPVFSFYGDYFETADDHVWIGTCAAAIKRQLLVETGGFESSSINAEDSDLWLRLGTAPGFVRVLKPPSFGYRRHPHSAVSFIDRTIRGHELMIRREMARKYPGGQERSSERLSIITRHLRPVSLLCLKTGRLAEAWNIYWRSFSWNLRLARLRYLTAFPLVALLRHLKGERHRPSAVT